VRFSHIAIARGSSRPSQRASMQSFPHSDEYSHFIAELRAAREEAGLSQATLAARLHVDRTVVTKAEGGGRRLDVIELRAWLSAMGVEFVPFVARLEDRLVRNAKPAQGKRPTGRR
jgi:ribosome-binding protein aMBF1 (putative translation factor)